MSIKRPDAYICVDCDHRFNDEDKIMEKVQIDGIFTLKVVCPKCHSPNIKTTISGKTE
ncbi:MAG: hypothetical protein K9W45_04975 [Candidatus Heimdallarchaeum aukensis]|uniref:Uncharacterized protein n=1 Tax=Candidatus Heimdallarchaeum aukensis TaxID=2876573 RepID=A0A9Y1FM94_9ARCH|nr:MAG: hypothetical protein K9W45_04975 [Candidatus Heimdallarchaeum aukensis]